MHEDFSSSWTGHLKGFDVSPATGSTSSPQAGSGLVLRVGLEQGCDFCRRVEISKPLALKCLWMKMWLPWIRPDKDFKTSIQGYWNADRLLGMDGKTNLLWTGIFLVRHLNFSLIQLQLAVFFKTVGADSTAECSFAVFGNVAFNLLPVFFAAGFSILTSRCGEYSLKPKNVLPLDNVWH